MALQISDTVDKDDQVLKIGGLSTKKMKRLITVVVCLVLCFNSVAFASVDKVDENDICATEFKETLTIDGVNYLYRYAYDKDGNREIYITNCDTNIVDLVKYNVTTGIATMNDMTVVSTMPSLDVMESEPGVSLNANYTYIGKVSKKISWVATTMVSQLVGIIASAIGRLTGAMVLAKIGATALKAMIKSYKNATVVASIYEWVTGKVTNHKYVWYVTPVGGSKHGPYTSYFGV